MISFILQQKPEELEAGVGIEPTNNRFAGDGLSTWLSRQSLLPSTFMRRSLQTFTLLVPSDIQLAKYGVFKKPFAGFLPGSPSELIHFSAVSNWKGRLKALSFTGAEA